MKIESKYNIGDKIYWMESNKCKCAIVKSIKFPLIQTLKGNIKIVGRVMYFVSMRTNSSIINWNGGGLYENEIFSSKKDLLKSL